MLLLSGGSAAGIATRNCTGSLRMTPSSSRGSRRATRSLRKIPWLGNSLASGAVLPRGLRNNALTTTKVEEEGPNWDCIETSSGQVEA